MGNEWKMVPAEPTAEMEDVGCQAYMNAEGMIGIMHKSSMGHAFQAMLTAAPVPPAGDVEVPRYDMSGFGDGMIEIQSCELSRLRDGQIDAFLALQSAPAAKGGE